jgi:glycosyltransferase involved in cell wall biosynthesis
VRLNSSANVFVLHDGSSLVDFDKVKSVKKRRPKAVYVGSTGRGRGIEWILRLAEKLIDYDFHIVGTIENHIIERNSGVSNVVFHGWKSKVEILLIVKDANVLLAPYQKDLTLDNGLNTLDYMSPLKIFEYMSYSVPMIVSDFPVIREVLEDKIDALLVRADDLNQWINSIRLLTVDPDLAKTLAKNACEKLKNEYTWEKRAERLIDIIEWEE